MTKNKQTRVYLFLPVVFDEFPGTTDEAFTDSFCANFPFKAAVGELAVFKKDKVRFTLALAEVVEATAVL